MMTMMMMSDGARRRRALPSPRPCAVVGTGFVANGGEGVGRMAGRAKNAGLPAPKACHRAWQSMAADPARLRRLRGISGICATPSTLPCRGVGRDGAVGARALPLPPIAVVCTGSCDRNGGGVDPSRSRAIAYEQFPVVPSGAKRSRGTCSCGRYRQEEVPPLRLAALGFGRDDGNPVKRDCPASKRGAGAEAGGSGET
jgi:hypothetical protein